MTFYKTLVGTKAAYIAELAGQYAQLVDGVKGHHGHGGHGQTPAHHVRPRRERVGAIDGGVEGGEAHHHHELRQNSRISAWIEMAVTILSVCPTHQEEAGADKLPAQPPVPSRPLADHLLDVVAESVHP